MKHEPKLVKDVARTMQLRGKLPAMVLPMKSSMPVTKFVDPDATCPCGSGLKFKKCCRRKRVS